VSRNVVVTGGATGIGRATAALFAAGGDAVTIVGRRVDALREAADAVGATAVVCDLSDPAQVAASLDRFPATVDVLVNNAGGNRDFDASEPGDLATLAEQWRANFDANVLTAVLVTEALSDRIADGGAVVSIGSIAAERGAESYGASKAALATWNLSRAAELGARGITANVVAPGYVAETEFFRDTLADERRSRLVGETATGRPGTPEDVAATIHFLASPGARHITGQVIRVNGGASTTR
jgi:3-oxoacyl-[acyl-carrier protein] reductase